MQNRRTDRAKQDFLYLLYTNEINGTKSKNK